MTATRIVLDGHGRASSPGSLAVLGMTGKFGLSSMATVALRARDPSLRSG
jgi:hypothetical protein